MSAELHNYVDWKQRFTDCSESQMVGDSVMRLQYKGSGNVPQQRTPKTFLYIVQQDF